MRLTFGSFYLVSIDNIFSLEFIILPMSTVLINVGLKSLSRECESYYNPGRLLPFDLADSKLH